MTTEPNIRTRWFPAVATSGHGWRLIRFEQVDAAGMPVGKPIEAVTPALRIRQFPTELRAQLAAHELNRADGL